jgi:hypothetical protein
MLHRVWKGTVGDNHMYHSSSSDSLTWTDQRKIVGLTSHGPALAVFNGRLHRAWKDDDTSRIYHSSSSDGLTWTDPHSTPGNTSHGPALAVYNDMLYLAYKFANYTSIEMCSLSPEGQWSYLRAIAGRTSHGPALRADTWNARLYCLWKGVGTDTRMFITSGSSDDPYLLLPVTAPGGGKWRSLAAPVTAQP